MKDKLQDISILRAISVLLVVAFHCYGFTFWGEHFNDGMRVRMQELYHFPMEVIAINIAMPMFTFISGYLFKYLLERGRYASWKDLLWKKATRILMPFFFWSSVMMLTTNSFEWKKLLWGGYFHLWYLPMLFCCFVIAYAINKWIDDVCVAIFTLLISFAFPFFANKIPSVFCFSATCIWFCWFLLGIYTYLWRNTFSDVLHKYHLDYLFILFYIVGNYFYPTAYGEHSIYGYLLQIGVTLGIWSLFYNMNAIQCKHFNILGPISQASFGLYIFHAWILLFMVSTSAKRIFNMEEIGLAHPILFPFCLFAINLALSYGLTWLLMKNRYGKMLVG